VKWKDIRLSRAGRSLRVISPRASMTGQNAAAARNQMGAARDVNRVASAIADCSLTV
jgi:hypothetical protein